jgi:DNA repair protein RadA/Sms
MCPPCSQQPGHKHARLRLSNQQPCHASPVQVKKGETSTDLAVAVAVVSSHLAVGVPRDMIWLGEVGLGGELRAVPHLQLRLLEAQKLGFTKAVVAASKGRLKLEDLGDIEVGWGGGQGSRSAGLSAIRGLSS